MGAWKHEFIQPIQLCPLSRLLFHSIFVFCYCRDYVQCCHWQIWVEQTTRQEFLVQISCAVVAMSLVVFKRNSCKLFIFVNIDVKDLVHNLQIPLLFLLLFLVLTYFSDKKLFAPLAWETSLDIKEPLLQKSIQFTLLSILLSFPACIVFFWTDLK